MQYQPAPEGSDFRQYLAEAQLALSEGDCIQAYTLMMVAAVLAPMDEGVAAIAEAISVRAGGLGNEALGKLTGLMLDARNRVLAAMIPGRQQIGAGSAHSCPDTSDAGDDALEGDWSEFWENSFRAAVMKDDN